MKKGQILLITVMILATVLTVVLSMSFKTVTETQMTKLEEENKKTLAAAEAAIEEALKTGSATFGAGGLTDFGSFTGGAETITTASNNFTTSLIPKDKSYTFYLSTYESETGKIIGESKEENIEICFQSTSEDNKPALEVTLIKADEVVKYPIDPDKGQEGRMSANVFSPSSICSSDNSYNHSYTITADKIGKNSKLLVVRVFYQPTKLHFSRSSDFPLQGKTISSTAISSSGVSKKITLFQTYPQIPAEFFYTSF